MEEGYFDVKPDISRPKLPSKCDYHSLFCVSAERRRYNQGLTHPLREINPVNPDTQDERGSI